LLILLLNMSMNDNDVRDMLRLIREQNHKMDLKLDAISKQQNQKLKLLSPTTVKTDQIEEKIESVTQKPEQRIESGSSKVASMEVSTSHDDEDHDQEHEDRNELLQRNTLLFRSAIEGKNIYQWRNLSEGQFIGARRPFVNFPERSYRHECEGSDNSTKDRGARGRVLIGIYAWEDEDSGLFGSRRF
jgi:hypothetical protein